MARQTYNNYFPIYSTRAFIHTDGSGLRPTPVYDNKRYTQIEYLFGQYMWCCMERILSYHGDNDATRRLQCQKRREFREFCDWSSPMLQFAVGNKRACQWTAKWKRTTKMKCFWKNALVKQKWFVSAFGFSDPYRKLNVLAGLKGIPLKIFFISWRLAMRRFFQFWKGKTGLKSSPH